MSKVAQKIHSFNKSRHPELLKYKYEAINENMYRFFRGTCHLFYEDMSKAGLPVDSPLGWICGDLHLENFGSYKSQNRPVYFDLNDFDEAALAPLHLEVARLLTSIYVAFNSLKIEKRKADKLASLFIDSYTATLKCGKATYIERQTAEGLVADFLKQVQNKSRKDALAKKTTVAKKNLTIDLARTKHLKPGKDLKKELIAHMQSWLENDENSPYNYKIVDCAFRLAGTGSLGVYRYVLLLKSSNDSGAKYLLIDIKQSMPSSLLPYLKNKQPQWESDSHRITAIQKMMQNRSPALLSTMKFRDKFYVVQELQPEKDSIDFTLIKDRYRDMCRVITDMAMLTASAQLRSAGRLGAANIDELIGFAEQDEWKTELLRFAENYSVKVEQDFKEIQLIKPVY